MDPVAVSADIGTWVAVSLALIALIGIIGPYLALQASLSDSNRAMNAIQDIPQKYVTHGFKITRGLRIFRRIRVPNLSPTYITNDPDNAALIPPMASADLWTLHQQDYLPWNTGWAKIAELIHAYRVHDPISNLDIGLAIPQNGTLEVVNSRTALVVHKQWILLLGLLGRYGKRSDSGILQATSIRRDFNGERGGISVFWTSTSMHYGASSTNSGSSRSLADGGSVDEREEPDAESEFEDGSGYEGEGQEDERHLLVGAHRRPWGGWTFEEEFKPIHGITGVLQYLGRHKGSWSYLSSVSFVPHTAKEIFDNGVTAKSEISSIQTLFWLAHGFLPSDRNFDDGKPVVICLESPSDDSGKMHSLIRQSNEDLFFELQLNGTAEIPVSMGNTLQCLGIPEVHIKQFLPTASPSGPEFASIIESDPKQSSILIRGEWMRFSFDEEPTQYFKKKDIEAILAAFLRLEWDPWGYLVLQENNLFWTLLLKEGTSILRKKKTPTPAFMEGIIGARGCSPFKWVVGKTFHAKKSFEYVQFIASARSLLQQTEIQPLSVALATLFILDRSFRVIVESIFKQISQGTGTVSTHSSPLDEPARAKEEASSGSQEAHQKESSGETVGHFSYTYNTKVLRWIPGEGAKRKALKETDNLWSLNDDLARAPRSETSVTIRQKEMIIVGLWAATRAALWLSSQDSRPLLELVGELDTHVYIL